MSVKDKFFEKYKIVLPKWMLEFSGKAYICPKPMFFQYSPAHHKVNGQEVRMILNNLKDGDILLRRYDGYLNSIFTPGFWGHGAIYHSNGTIIHAVSQGVVSEDILEFCRCDSIAVLRVKNVTEEQVKKALNTADVLLGSKVQYDYRFETGNDKVYCTELVDICYDNIFKDEYSEELGNKLLTPGHIFCSDHIEKILVVKH